MEFTSLNLQPPTKTLIFNFLIQQKHGIPVYLRVRFRRTPDKVADQISDALIDNFLAFDPSSKVACETLVTTGQVVLAGEVKSKTYLDVQEIARGVIRKIGYTKAEYMFEANSCGVLSAIHEQSADINRVLSVKQGRSGCRRSGYDVWLCHQRNR